MKINAIVYSAALASTVLLAAPALATDQNIAVNLTVESDVVLKKSDGSIFDNIELKNDNSGKKHRYYSYETVIFYTNDMTKNIIVTPTKMDIEDAKRTEKHDLYVYLGGKEIAVGNRVNFTPSEYWDSVKFLPLDFKVGVKPSKEILDGGLPAGDYSGTIALSITQGA
ncbi:hypothetical protein [Xanthomonas theicola]|uniref:hypothetical protein n=1 Tax=Xanthomonas theicola TaxID=56464 RepID=UPI000FF8B286|nr:hypothetical protein [Xanthomonas theicola]QNH25519.1 hypothetical protein G4Q83_13230 [Xanthomonas theicola]